MKRDAGTAPRLLRAMQAVIASGDAALIGAVERGEISIVAAADLAKLPPAKRNEILETALARLKRSPAIEIEGAPQVAHESRRDEERILGLREGALRERQPAVVECVDDGLDRGHDLDEVSSVARESHGKILEHHSEQAVVAPSGLQGALAGGLAVGDVLEGPSVGACHADEATAQRLRHAKIVELAERIAKRWREDEGITGGMLDELEEAVYGE